MRIPILFANRSIFSTYHPLGNFYTFSKNYHINNQGQNEIKLPEYMHLYKYEENKIELLHCVISNMTVIQNFISIEEEQNLLNELEPILRRKRYEFDHWDEAIHGFRETEYKEWNAQNKQILKRVQDTAFKKNSPNAKPNVLEHVHVLDLSKDGKINPHVDSVRFCGNTIAGLSLISDSVMRLRRSQGKNMQNTDIKLEERQDLLTLDILLKRRSLYIMSHVARYDFTHEILDKANSVFNNTIVPRDRRISVICRNHPC